MSQDKLVTISFPAENKELAECIGMALKRYGQQSADKVFDLGGASELSEELQSSKLPPGTVATVVPSVSSPLIDNTGNEDDSTTPALDPAVTTPTVNATTGEVDQNGVAKNPHYCGTAQDPFYASGKRAGQWKKRKGVSDEDYDAWYASAKANVHAQSATTTEGQQDPVNTAVAFGDAQQTVETQDPELFTDFNLFIRWASEMQTAGHIVQEDIDAAYKLNNVTMMDLIPPSPNAAQNVSNCHAALLAKVPA